MRRDGLHAVHGAGEDHEGSQDFQNLRGDERYSQVKKETLFLGISGMLKSFSFRLFIALSGIQYAGGHLRELQKAVQVRSQSYSFPP